MTSSDAGPVRLLAGTSADERRPPIHPGPEREWHLPAHARDPAAVRARMSAQVVAGADVLLAHTFLTHRRALARVGEARRARELTVAAVVLARDAAEQGRDRRGQDAPWAMAPVLVAGVLPPFGEDPGSGRLGPLEAAVARDLHDQAGLLADAGVDLILVDGPRTSAETAAAVTAARSMGLETWAVVDAASRPAEDEWVAPDATLLSVGIGAVAPDRATGETGYFQGEPRAASGILLESGLDPSLHETATGWLAAGATLLGINDGATPDRLAILRAAIDDHERARSAERDIEASSWLDWVARGAATAPPGAAVWLADQLAPALTPGWDWTVVSPDDLRLLPARRYRLVVSESPGPPLDRLALRLDDGGVLVAMIGPSVPLPDHLQAIDLRDVGAHRWLIARRR